MSQQAERDRHGPVFDRLERLVRRGQDAGDFDSRLSPAWLLATTVALGHAAGEQVGAGRMTAEDAANALKRSILRLFGANELDDFSSTATHNDPQHGRQSRRNRSDEGRTSGR
jgi:hypothetical protein